MSGFRVQSDAPETTEAIGTAWGEALVPGDVLLLSGDLGTGKTTLVRGLARGLGVKHGVKSPSFAIHLSYPGRTILHHLDLYRVLDPRDLDELGLDDVFGGEGICVVEWGERLGGEAPPGAAWVVLEDDGPSARVIRVEAPEALCRRLRAGMAPGRVLDPEP
jgi:tRNA threonylcarbamoyladenosine biosynthesis protein TsaE